MTLEDNLRSTGDRIVLRGIRATGHHGVFDHERRDGQEFVVDVELGVDLARAAATDALADTVDYGAVAADVVARITGRPYDLIESVAELIAADAVARPLVEWVQVTVHKPSAPVGVPFGDVEVVLTRHRPRTRVVIAAGANLGNLAETLLAAVSRVWLLPGIADPSISPLYRTEPVGGPEQPAYLNAVMTATTTLSPRHLLRLLHKIEAEFGRERTLRWGPRTIDLDLIQWGIPGQDTEIRSEDPELTLPHPRAHERGFVLVPWAALDPLATLRMPDGSIADVAALAAERADGVTVVEDP